MEQKNSQTFKIDKKYHKDILSFVKLNEHCKTRPSRMYSLNNLNMKIQ